MTDQTDDEHLVRLRVTAAGLRQRMGTTAASVAMTEDRVADTLDRLARVRPHEAERLRARAAHARLFAALERDRAAEYGCAGDLPDEGGVQHPGCDRPGQPA